MKNLSHPLWLVFAIVLLMAVVSNFSRLRREHDRIPWRTDFAAARAESQKSHKPMLAYFTATWCGYCQEMHRTTWSDPDVEQALQGYVPVKIDIDGHPDLSRKYSVNGIPSYAVLDEQGNVLRSGDGYRDSNQFIAWIGGKLISRGAGM